MGPILGWELKAKPSDTYSGNWVFDRVRVAGHRWLLAVSGLLVVAASAVFCQRYLDPEATIYLVDHLRDAPLVVKIFDIQRNDYSIFRARELSYFFNILDGYFIWWSFQNGLEHYLSVVFYCCLALITFGHQWFCSRYLSEPRHQTGLFVLLYLSSASVFMSGSYFRTSKILVSVCAFFLAWMVFLSIHLPRTARDKKFLGWRWAASVGLLVLAGALCDEQGVLLGGLFLCLFGGLFVLVPNVRLGFGSLGVGVGLIFYAVYRSWLGPMIIAYFFKQPPPQNSLGKFGMSAGEFESAANSVVAGLGMLWTWYQTLFGSNALTAGLVGGASAVLVVYLWRKPFGRLRWVPIGVSVLVFTFFIVGNTLMVARHPPLALPFVRIVYYGLPFITLALVGTQILVAVAQKHFPQIQTAITAGLVVLLVANIFALPSQIQIRRQGYKKFLNLEYESIGDGIRQCIHGNLVVPKLYSAETQLCTLLN
jgi:hypothetical protein